MGARKRNYLNTLLLIFSLLFLFSSFTGEAAAAGSDATGWSITNADSTSGPADLGNGDATSITPWKPAIEVYSSGRAVKNGGSVKTDIYNTHAVRVGGAGSSLDLIDVLVQVASGDSRALYALNDGAITMTGGAVQTLADNQHSGYNSSPSYAVYADKASVITLNSVDVATKSGLNNLAVVADNGSTVKLNRGSVYTDGANSAALVASGDRSAIYADGVKIVTEGDGADGVLVKNPNNLGSASVSFDNCRITTNGDNSSGIRIANAHELFLKDTQITTNGKNSRGITAEFGAKAYLENAVIEVNNPGGAYPIALHIQYGADVTLKNGSFRAPTALHTAIRSVGLASYAKTKVTGLEGVYNIFGGIYAAGNTLVDITMDNGSMFTGWTEYTSNDATTAVNLTLNGPDTKWNMVWSSYLTNLTLDNSTVDFESSPAFTTLTVERLNPSGSGKGGTFIMKADIPSLSSDRLMVGIGSSGFYDIKVLNIGSADVTGGEIVTLAESAFGSTVSFDLASIVEYGGWQYDMNYLQGGIMPGTGTVNNLWQLMGTGRASAAGSGAINSFAGSYLMAYADTQTLIQRMGDLRDSPYGQGLWFRVHGGKFESSSKSYVRGFDMDYGGVQIGYDRKLKNKMEGDLYVGAMFGYSKGDLDYGHEGSGEVDSKTLGIYGTYIGRSGFYVDAVLKYQWMTNDFDVIDTAGTLVRGQDVDTGGIGASVEFGQRLHVGKGKDNGAGWYVEPQVQLSYQRQDGGYFNATNGLRIGVEPFTSILGRVGMQAGYETKKTNLYVKVSKVKEFDGDLTIRANSVYIPESFASSWWVYGIGYTSRINGRNSLYIDIERTSGGSFSQPWRVFAGWRVEF